MPMNTRNRPLNDNMHEDSVDDLDTYDEAPEQRDEAPEQRAESAPAAAVPAPGRIGASTSVDTETFLAGVMQSFMRMQAETNRTLVETLRALPYNGSGNPPTSTPTPETHPPSAHSSAVTGGNFSKCTARFDGRSRDAEVLEAFIDAVQVFKECASVSDEHALRGLPMLLQGDAAVWWRGARAAVHAWPDAVARLRAMYGMQQPPYKVLREIVDTEQKDSERADVFICRVRSLFVKLPYAVPTCMQLDLIYGLLHRRVRKRLPRDDVNDVDILIEKTLIVGRIIQGISFGIIMPLRPVLIAEYTSPKHRGSFLTTISLSQTIGIGVVHFIGSLMRWQYTALACCAFPLLSLILTLYSPESPSWLALRGDFDRCRSAFHWLRGEGEEDELDKMIQSRIAVKQERITAETPSKLANIKTVATKREVYKPVILAMHVYLLAQLSGAITLPNYSPHIIGALMGPDNQNMWMVELDILRLITNILAVFIMARVQRRTMMFSSGILCLFSHIGVASYAYMITIYPDLRMNWIPVLFLNLQMASIGVGMVPMANVITGEIFPLEYRSILGTVSVVAVAGTMFMVLKTFPGLLVGTGLHGTYAVYFGILAYGLVVTWFLLPETKGKTLQEIEEHFRGAPIVPEQPEAELLKGRYSEAAERQR